MGTKLFKIFAVPLVAFLAMGSSCPLIPKLEDRVVELAARGHTSVQFHAQGLINTIDITQTVNVDTDLDLAGVLTDAGIDASDVKDVKVSGVSYRVVQQDPSIDRQIQGGTVKIGRGTGPVAAATPLVTNFNEGVNFVTSFKQAPLDPAGVALINALLADVLAKAKGDIVAVPNPDITYRIQGQSIPVDENTDFIWEIKLDVSVVGTIKVQVLN